MEKEILTAIFESDSYTECVEVNNEFIFVKKEENSIKWHSESKSKIEISKKIIRELIIEKLKEINETVNTVFELDNGIIAECHIVKHHAKSELDKCACGVADVELTVSNENNEMFSVEYEENINM